MDTLPRKKQFLSLFPDEPAYRWRQIERGLFDPQIDSWEKLTTFSKPMRQVLAREIPWISCELAKLQSSNHSSVFKAVLKLKDGLKIESVLMRNKRGQWTVCVSSQVGCSLGCGFCATGKMGFKRDLSEDEIIDQLRFWLGYLKENRPEPERISNIVMMGMGEPLLNYENVKTALKAFIDSADIGPTRITVSTAGPWPRLGHLLHDANWPPVRLAVSLNAVDEAVRQRLMPATPPGFLNMLQTWAKRYLKRYGNRRHHLTFEYILLKGINDQPEDAKKLAVYLNKIGRIKVNLIPYNKTAASLESSQRENLEKFLSVLEKNKIIATVRRSLGDDISAACGQLISQ